MPTTVTAVLRTTAVACVAVALITGSSSAQVSPDSTALVAIYDALGGDSWNENTNWKSANPISTWFGVTVNGSNRVDGLHLPDNNLNGVLPDTIWTLTDLKLLKLSTNNLAGSTIPPAIGNLVLLEEFKIWEAGLTGGIPTEISLCDSLTHFWVSSNNLSGSIPDEITDLPKLTLLNLNENQLTGTIPDSIGNLASLEELLLNMNELTGAIPSTIGNLAQLRHLQAFDNQLSGSIPVEIGSLDSLQWLELNDNELTGSIPSEICNLSQLWMLDLKNNQLSGVLPDSLGNLVNLQRLMASDNLLTGEIPTTIGNLGQLTNLELFNNQLTGTIPAQIGSLTSLDYLDLNNNQLSGPIPSGIGNLGSLTGLMLNYNDLSGTIPTWIGNLTELRSLGLEHNQLTGGIPDTITALTNLEWLFLAGNELSGPIPTDIGNLTALRGAWLYSNALSGSVPVSITNLDSVQNISLGGNQLTGLPDLSSWGPTLLSEFHLAPNLLQFGDLEPNVGVPGIAYSPQGEVGTPDSVEANAGDDVTLDAVVSGSVNAYQWYKDGSPLGGETNASLTLNDVTAADNGDYHAEVTNAVVTGLTLQTALKILSVTDSLRIAVTDTVAPKLTQMLLPVTVDDATNFDVVSFELKVAFDSAIAQPGTPDATEITNTLIENWGAIEENVIPGGARDTLLVAASTADQVLDAAGTLLWLVFDVQDVGVPSATPVELVEVLFNDGTPGAIGTDGEIEIIVPVQTDPDGANPVTVTLVDQQTGNTPVEMTFGEVTVGGETTMITLEEASTPFPEGFQVTQDVIVFDLVTTASFDDSITVEYDYTGATVGDESLLRLLHYEVDEWVDVTTSLDTLNNILTGRVASLSEFGVGQSTGVDGVVDTDPDQIGPGADVTVTVDDPNENKDADVAEYITVLAFDVDNSDSQEVTLEETGLSTGVFSALLYTEFADGGTTNDDGVLGVLAGDTVYVAYTDTLNSESTTEVMTAFSEVVGGTDGVLLVSFAVQALDGRQGVRDTVRVQVADDDGNTAPGTADDLTVRVTNPRSGEVEDLTLPETDVDTGVFRIRVPTVTTAPVDNDGELSLEPDDTLSVAYEDALTAVGSSVTLTENVQVVSLFGDVQQNNKVQAFDAAFILATCVELTTPTGRDTILMDVDGSGTLRAMDASYVLQYVVRLIDRFPVQTDSVYSPPGDSLRNHPFLKPVSLDRVIALGEIQPLGDGAYRIPVRLGERTGVLSATLEVSVAPGLQVTDVEGGDGYGGFMTAHHTSEGVTRIALAGSQSDLEGPGDVLWITMEQTEEGPVQLSLDSVSLNGMLLTPEGGMGAVQDLRDESRDDPLVFALHPNYPNPFNPSTTIRYDVPEVADVRIVVYNTLGQEVATLLYERRQVGAHAVVWDGMDARGRQVSSGIYVVRMTGPEFTQVRKVLLLK